MNDGTIFLIRHGITNSNIEKVYAGWGEEELNGEGIAQTNMLGGKMQGWGISTIYASPIKRALQTAQILNRYIGEKLVIEPDFEEMKMGPWEGLSERKIAVEYPSEYKIWLEKPGGLKLHGRETLDEVQQRAVRAINKILKIESGRISLVVTHVAIIRCLFLYFNHLPLNLYKTIDIPNLSVFQLTWGKRTTLNIAQV